VITEGFFTEDEVNSACAHGAEIKSGKGGRRELHFPTAEKYEAWMTEQKELHPNRWADSMKVSVKN
jgi:hypothetical protein